MNPPNYSDEPGERQLRVFLAQHRVRARIIAPGVPMPTVPLAAAAIGVDQDQIIKSLLFQDKHDAVVLAIAAGAGRIDRVQLAEIAQLSKLKLAAPEIVFAKTGYPAGGVAPIGHRIAIPVVMDERVLSFDPVYGGGGSEITLLEISPKTIVDLTGAAIAKIVE